MEIVIVVLICVSNVGFLICGFVMGRKCAPPYLGSTFNESETSNVNHKKFLQTKPIKYSNIVDEEAFSPEDEEDNKTK